MRGRTLRPGTAHCQTANQDVAFRLVAVIPHHAHKHKLREATARSNRRDTDVIGSAQRSTVVSRTRPQHIMRRGAVLQC
jgi:hypothetical protein